MPPLIAHIERLYCDSIFAKGIEGSSTIAPYLNIITTNMRLKCVQSLNLAYLEYDIYDLLIDTKHLSYIQTPQKIDTYIAIARSNYIVHIKKLEKWQYILLNSIKDDIDIDTLLDEVSIKTDISKESLKARLMIWLPIARDLGYVDYCYDS
jgi:hypothetical protein